MGKPEIAEQIQRAFIFPHGIELFDLTVLRGPNRWTYRPVLEALVDIGELEDFPSNTLEGFPQRLSAWLPSLVEHRCSYGETGGFLRRVDEGTWPAHILEHVTLELQNLAGLPGGFGRARETSRRGVYTVAVSAFDEHITEFALRRARDLVLAAILDAPFDLVGVLNELRARVAQLGVSPITFGLISAAEKRGIPCQRLGNCDLLQLGYGTRQQRLRLGETERTSAIADGIARDYALSKQLLEAAGLPVPEGSVVNTLDDAQAAFASFDSAVRVRAYLQPAERVTTPAALIDVYTRLSVAGDDVIVEPETNGEIYQLLMIGGRLVWAAAQTEVTPEVGTALDLSTRVHPSIERAAALAARIIGLNTAMVEIVADNLLLPLREQSAAILSVSTGAHALTKVTDRPLIDRISGALLEHLFAHGEAGRIPVVGVAGSNGTTATTHLLAELLRGTGKRTGVASADGVFLDARRLPPPLGTAWHAAQQILANRTVETAVIENNLQEIATSGLAYDRCTVGVVLNLDPSLSISPRGIDNVDQLYTVLRTQVDVVLKTGCAVLNADDPNVLKMAPLSDGEVMLFAADGLTDDVRTHLAAGQRAVFFRNGAVVLATGGLETVLHMGECGMCISSLGAHDAAHRTTIVSAIAAAWALDTPVESLQAGLMSYMRDIGSVSAAAA